jgi:uncharacterized protein (TIGR02466 family)
MASETETEINLVFPTAIQVSEIGGADALNEKLVKEIEAVRDVTPNGLPNSWSCDVYTTISNNCRLHEKEGFSELVEHIHAETQKFADFLAISQEPNRLRISDCWVNIYGRGHSQEIHAHANNIVSGVYYVTAPECASPIMFHSPDCDLMLAPAYTELNDYNNAAVGFEPKAGTMVIFRSHVKHSVKTSVIDEERISIAFNLRMN